MSETSNDPALAAGMCPADGPTGIINTDYTIGRDNIEGSLGPLGFDMHNPVFAISALSVIAFVAFTLMRSVSWYHGAGPPNVSDRKSRSRPGFGTWSGEVLQRRAGPGLLLLEPGHDRRKSPEG
ncbi:MAG TPA: hypothetical protein P5558_04615 [Geminicoccaceae bacterium]|nr:hypothetical protein [Geminicoccaceae bacterium]